jgi:hypothetical protein
MYLIIADHNYIGVCYQLLSAIPSLIPYRAWSLGSQFRKPVTDIIDAIDAVEILYGGSITTYGVWSCPRQIVRLSKACFRSVLQLPLHKWIF